MINFWKNLWKGSSEDKTDEASKVGMEWPERILYWICFILLGLTLTFSIIGHNKFKNAVSQYCSCEVNK
jgi:hypothetical protein